MAESSEVLINSLNNRISKLEADLARTAHESKQRKVSLRDLQAKLEQATTELKALETDRDAWKTKAEAAPSDLQVKLDEANARLTARDHEDAWREAIGLELADKATVRKVWAELDYKPGDKIPTKAEIAEQTKAAREAAPYLFKTAPDGADDPGGSKGNGRPPLQGADSDSSRGSPDKSGKSMRVRRSDLQDPRWALNAANQKAMTEASAAGLLEVVDG